MLMANAAAILTDAFPARQRGMALGINQIAGDRRPVRRPAARRAAGRVGLARGVLGERPDRRGRHHLVLPEPAWRSPTTRRARIDWARQHHLRARRGLLLAAITHGIQPYGGHTTGWTSPCGASRAARRAPPCWPRSASSRPRSPNRCSRWGLFQIRAFAAGNAAEPARLDRPRRPAVHAGDLAGRDLAAAARVRLRGHARCGPGIYMLPLTTGFLLAGPGVRATCRTGSARARSPPRACWCAACAFCGLMLLPVDFPYWRSRAAHLRQRDRLGPVRLPQHLGDHEQRPGPPPRLGVGHAGHASRTRGWRCRSGSSSR